MRTYRRDARGRFARTGKSRKPSRKYGRIGAVTAGALLVGGPAYVPIAAGLGFAGGRAIDRAVTRRRS